LRTATAPSARTAKAKLSYKDQRELDLLPAEIEALHQEIAAHEAAIADPSLYARDQALFMKHSQALDAARERLARCEDRWLELAERAEALGA
jgi:ATP-binding cassette subfamily F protein uup